jgi:lysyl-tRNA synthetase class II
MVAPPKTEPVPSDKKPKTVGECMVKVFEEKVEENLVQPTFIIDHPIEKVIGLAILDRSKEIEVLSVTEKICLFDSL